ncbi:hypothetical protein DL765_010653 [Monosporascus sp. GIB2]|nr:hypothetical protein DL765_010653 [Monosporascus sp. GIB2]
MRIDVDLKFIEITQLKASLTRPPIDLSPPLFAERVPASNVTVTAEILGTRRPDYGGGERLYEYLQQSGPAIKAFWGIEAMGPLQMGILLGDSPVGNVIWPYVGMRGSTPGYDVRIYRELQREGTLDYAFPYVPVPVSVLQYFGDAGYGAPHH